MLQPSNTFIIELQYQLIILKLNKIQLINIPKIPLTIFADFFSPRKNFRGHDIIKKHQ